MIYSICGRPRSGKSYESVVYHIIPAVKSGRKVVTNVSLNVDWFVKMFGEQVRALIRVVDGQLNDFGKMDRPFSKFEHYQDDWRDEQNRGPLFVIDEAHMVLPNRNLEPAILEFYSLHGHYGFDIILLTQDLRKIHRDIKAMIEMTYYCAKNTAFGSDKTYTKKVRIGATTEVVNEEQRKYKSAYFPAYQSHTQSKGSVAEAMANDIKPVWKSWPFFGSVLFIFGGLFYLVYFFILSGDDPVPVPAKTEQQTVQASVPAGQPGQLPQKTKPKSDFGPLDDFTLFVTGYSKQIAFSNRARSSGELNRDLSFYRIYISVFDSNQQLLFSSDQTQLQQIGYVFSVLAECVYEVKWHDVSRILTCKEPEQQADQVDRVLGSVPTFDI